MLTIKQLYNGEEQSNEAQRRNDSFNTHVCLPCIVQSYNESAMTIEAQPAIRERYVGEDGKIQYVNYPLLINVPVCFPSAGGFHIKFPINQGDECIVIFSDLSIDNFWLYGNVQNPVEQRRHDLSDGLAIMGFVDQKKLNKEKYKKLGNGLNIFQDEKGSGISIDENGVTIYYWDIDPDTKTPYRTSKRWGI